LVSWDPSTITTLARVIMFEKSANDAQLKNNDEDTTEISPEIRPQFEAWWNPLDHWRAYW
jgi:hypothetical protein